jgi:hypothetical protein
MDRHGRLVEKLSSKPEPEEPTDPADYPMLESAKKAVLTTHEGVNRIAWNLTYEGPKLIKGAKIYSLAPNVGPVALPGSYTLRLTVDQQTYTAPLEVRPDPRLKLRPSELGEQLELTLAIRDATTRLTGLVERLRKVRKQLADRNELLKGNADATELFSASREMITRLDTLEDRLHNPKAEILDDLLSQKGGTKLYSQLAWLYFLILDSDGAPTQGVKEVYAGHAAELGKVETEFQKLLYQDLAQLNDLAKKQNVPTTIVPSNGANSTGNASGTGKRDRS